MSSTKLDYYTKLRDYRCEVVEGIRQLAVRNMGHFIATVNELGFDDISNEKSLLAVQAKMLEDQQLLFSRMHRDFLGYVTFVPWEIYTCLVAAEFESYASAVKKDSSLRFTPLDEFVNAEQALIASMNKVRHKLLHPLKKVSYEDALEDYFSFAQTVAPDHMFLVVGLQDLIDDFLENLREELRACLEEETVSLSDQQVYEHVQTIKRNAMRVKSETDDDEIQSAMDKIWRDQNEFEKFLGPNVDPGKELSKQESAELEGWEQKLHTLMVPLPGRGLEHDLNRIQIPFHKELLGLFPDPRTADDLGWVGESLPHYARKWRKDCVSLLFRSLIMLNEPYTATMTMLRSKYPGKSRQEMVTMATLDLKTASGQTSGEMDAVRDLASHVFVSKALLVEPLQIYRQVTAQCPELKIESIESRLTKDAMKSFREFRNIVFHVPDERTDHFKAELAFHKNATLLMEPSLTGDLLKFYLSEDVRQRLESVI